MLGPNLLTWLFTGWCRRACPRPGHTAFRALGRLPALGRSAALRCGYRRLGKTLSARGGPPVLGAPLCVPNRLIRHLPCPYP